MDTKFFGPFVSSEAVKKSIKEIQKIFQVRNCSDTTFANRTRPCIEFQMKRCSAPCVHKINKVDYFEDIASAKSYLSSSVYFLLPSVSSLLSSVSIFLSSVSQPQYYVTAVTDAVKGCSKNVSFVEMVYFYLELYL